jgi:peptidoglycan/LPS O-acetylase OafA/YrhL
MILAIGGSMGVASGTGRRGILKRLARILPLVAIVSAVLATFALVFSNRAAFAYSAMRLMIEVPSIIVDRLPTRQELVEARESARSFARVWHVSVAFFVVTLGLSLWSARAEVRRWPWFSAACLAVELGAVYLTLAFPGPLTSPPLLVVLACTAGAAFELWRVRKDARRSSAVRWSALVVGLGAIAACVVVDRLH